MKPEFREILTETGSDPVFVLIEVEIPPLMEPLWIIAWRDSLKQIPKTGGFVNQYSAYSYLIENRQKIIDADFEDKFL